MRVSNFAASAAPLRTVRTALLALALVAAAATGACSSADTGGNTKVSPDGTLVDGGVLVAQAPDIVPSKLEADLKAAGLDPANLPDFETLIAGFEATPGGGEAVAEAAKPLMTLFATSLGLECKSCHSGPQYAVPVARRNVVAGMWNSFVRELRLKRGGLLFCDSCHQGKESFLVREDEKGLAAWMATNFAKGLVSKTGAENTCTTCHGEPFKGEFLDAWAARK